MRIGLDIDGCLADFDHDYVRLFPTLTGRDLFPPWPFAPPCWYYPEYYGYTKEEVSTVWSWIKGCPTFWLNLSDYQVAYRSVRRASNCASDGHDVYFISSRPGIKAKDQTEMWLRRQGMLNPTVLTSSEKGLCAKALNLDYYIDDRPENVLDVLVTSPRTHTYLLNKSHNRADERIHMTSRVESMAEFFAEIANA